MTPHAFTRAEAAAAAALVALGLGAVLVLERQGAPAPPEATSLRLDLNAASPDELALLPGVGPAIAARLVAARPLRGLDDARAVLGAEGFARVEAYVRVGAAPDAAPATTR